MANVNARMRVRQDTAANFTTNNPVVLAGEWAYEIDTAKLKIGDGSTVWTSLPYKAESSFSASDAALLASAEQTANKGVAGGYAPLDSNSYVPLENLPPTAKSSKVVADITARDAIIAGERFEGLRVHVLDATDDTTVVTGGAGYILGAALTNASWSKMYEAESLDLDFTNYIQNSAFDANSILKADTDDTPIALTVGPSTIVGRASAGNIAALTPDQVRTVINVENGADVTDATNVAAAGAVMETDYGANQVLASSTAGTTYGITVNTSSLVGRASSGNITSLVKADALAILNVEDGADVTDAINVRAAGAVMVDDVIFGGNSTL